MHWHGLFALWFCMGIFFYSHFSSKRLQSRMLQSCLVNGGIFLGSIIIFEIGLMFLPQPVMKNGWLLSSLFYWLWVYPIFVVSLFINNRAYRDIGHDAYMIFLGSIRKERGSMSQSVFSPIAVRGYYWILLGTLIIQAKALYFIPFIGSFLSFTLFSLITSWYSFEYAWNCLNYSLEKKVQIIEENWIYFLGFGAPLTLATFFSPFLLNQGIFAFIFPFV